MAIIYRKRSGSLPHWHNNPECPNWPLAVYLQRTDLPSEDFLCVECVRLLDDEAHESDESDI